MKTFRNRKQRVSLFYEILAIVVSVGGCVGRGAFAFRWTDFDPPQGGGVMPIRMRTRDKWSHTLNSLKRQRLWRIVHEP